jgi:hypothetical protein
MLNLLILSGGDPFDYWWSLLFEDSVSAECAFYASAT